MRQKDQIFWQHMAKFYTAFMSHSTPLYKSLCARIAPWLSSSMTVLELACGTGQLSLPLAPYVQHWQATDLSSEMVARAKARAGEMPQLYFSTCDATRLSCADACFDAVVIANALHIMPAPERALFQIRRVLKPGGLLFAPTFVHSGGLLARLRTDIMQLSGFRVYHSWSSEAFLDFLSSQGFHILEHATLSGPVLPLCHVVCQIDHEGDLSL